MLNFKRISLAAAVVALVAGCSSGVKLNDASVEDRNAAGSRAAAGAPRAAVIDVTDVEPREIRSQH